MIQRTNLEQERIKKFDTIDTINRYLKAGIPVPKKYIDSLKTLIVDLEKIKKEYYKKIRTKK